MIAPLLTILCLPFVPKAIDEEVKFVGMDGLELTGTLTRPTEGNNVPAVLLLPGSGPTDRDGNSPLLGVITNVHKQIAEELAAKGIASLRFDKRAVRHYSASWPKDIKGLNDYFGWDRFVGDATAAYRFLKAQNGIDAKRIGIIGHSEGGLITLQISSDLAKSEPPKAIVLLGTCGRKMGPVIHDQVERSLGRSGLPAEKQKVLQDYTDAGLAALSSDKPLPPNPPAELAGLFNPTAEKLMRSYCTIDPLVLAASYAGPVLVINGQDDTQVSAVKDAPALEAAFKKRPKGSVALLLVPSASHNLKSTATGNKDAFNGPVAPEAIAAISKFLGKQL